MNAKQQLIAAARAGGSDAVRRLQENGGPQEVVTVRCPWSADLMQYRLTDNNMHSVKIIEVRDGRATLSAPAGYQLQQTLVNVFSLEIA